MENEEQPISDLFFSPLPFLNGSPDGGGQGNGGTTTLLDFSTVFRSGPLTRFETGWPERGAVRLARATCRHKSRIAFFIYNSTLLDGEEKYI